MRCLETNASDSMYPLLGIYIASYLIEIMALSEMGPQLKLPINIMKGSMPLQCNIFSTNSCHLKYQNTC